jgi:hypothetical protein
MTPGRNASQRETVLAGQTVCGTCGCGPAGSCRPPITLRVYAHVIGDQLTEAADIFARAVSAAI